MEVELDGVVFRLVKVRYSSGDAAGRAHVRGPHRLLAQAQARRASRVARPCTRAEFVLSLLREVRARQYRFVCPELHVRQPIDAGKKSSRAARATPLGELELGVER
jgi:hypothetical protein